MAAEFYSAAIGLSVPTEEVLARIAFLEDELAGMDGGAALAEIELRRRPTDPAARARLELLYMMARDINKTIEQLRRALPVEMRQMRVKRV
ncbi:MAG: hypothetical protein AB7O88_05015 [Reyranellaceae bacterium]